MITFQTELYLLRLLTECVLYGHDSQYVLDEVLKD